MKIVMTFDLIASLMKLWRKAIQVRPKVLLWNMIFSKQLMLFWLAVSSLSHYSSCEVNCAVEWQTADGGGGWMNATLPLSDKSAQWRLPSENETSPSETENLTAVIISNKIKHLGGFFVPHMSLSRRQNFCQSLKKTLQPVFSPSLWLTTHLTSCESCYCC